VDTMNLMRPLALLGLAMTIAGCTSPALRNPMPSYVMGTDDDGAPLTVPFEGRPASDADDASSERRVDIYRGTGELVGAPRPEGAVQQGQRGKEVELNFSRVDLQEVVQTILGDLLQENFIIDPGVSGEVSLQTSRPVAREDLIPVLQELLRVHNAILVREPNGMFRVSTREGYRGAGFVPELAKNGKNLPEGYGVRIVPLEYISVAEMQKILEPLAPQGAILRADTNRNLLILQGSRTELTTLIETIETFDVDWLAGMSVGFFELKYSSVEEVATALSAVFGAEGEGPMAGMVRVVPLERLKGLLLITPRAGILTDARRWIERFDRQEFGEGVQLFVYHVQNGKAGQLAGMLGQLYGGEGGSSSSSSTRPASVAPGLAAARSGVGGSTGFGSSGSSLTSNSRSSLSSKSSNSTTTSGTTTTSGGTTSGSSLNESSPTSAITTEITAGQEPVRIVANEDNNSLVVLATPEEYRKLETALKRLDVPPMQVLIEASIVEVRLEDSLSYGLSWYFNNALGGSRRGAGQFGSVPSTLPGTVDQFNYAISNSTGRITALLNALATDKKIRVISSPSLLVLDNHTAEIRVGDQVPIVTGSVTSTVVSDSAAVTNTYQYRDTGVILEVTPRVNAGGLVTMEVVQEVSDVERADDTSSSSSTTTLQPTITQRSIKSTVAVQSGETVVLGGLIKGNNENNNNGIPGLKDIPGLGLLFGGVSNSQIRTELVVLLTPTAVKDQIDLNAATNEVRSKMKALQEAYQESREPVTFVKPGQSPAPLLFPEPAKAAPEKPALPVETPPGNKVEATPAPATTPM